MTVDKTNEQEQAVEQEKPKYSTFVVHTAKYKTLLTKKFKERIAYVPNDPKKIVAFIPGTIKKIHIKEGKSIKVGQILLVLEAMKMNNVMKASMAGKVKKIHIVEEERVSKGHLLIEME